MQGIQICLNEGSRTFQREDIDNRGDQKKKIKKPGQLLKISFR